MTASPAFRAFVRDLLDPFGAVDDRAMFGGAGVYVDGLMIALIAQDTLHLKTDAETRAAFEAAGLEPFQPFDHKPMVMSYHRAPEEALDDPDALRPWIEGALAAARRAAARKRPRTKRRAP
jgi:DNA transformation protein